MGERLTGPQLSIWPDTGSYRRMVAITTTNPPLFLQTSFFLSFGGNTRHVDVCIEHTYIETDIQRQTHGHIFYM